MKRFLKMKITIFLLIATPLVLGVEVGKCANGVLPLQVNITGCDKQPCAFKRGQRGAVDISFELPKTVQKLTPMVVIPILSPKPLSVPCPGNDCAKAVNLTMPMAAGVKGTLHLKGEIPKVSPVMRSSVWEWQSVDENKVVVFCFKISVEIK